MTATINDIDRRRVYKFSGHRIDDGAQGNHRGAFGLLARALPDIAAQLTCRQQEVLELGGGRLRMAGKALESFPAAWYPLSTYPWDRGAKSSTASEQVASSLSGYPCGVQHDRPLQGCSAVRVKIDRSVPNVTGNNCSSHLGGPGEPRGATRDPRGRDLRRPDGPDDGARRGVYLPGGERG